MLRLLTDEDVHGAIIRGLHGRAPELDLVRAMDVGLGHTADPRILEWAAFEGRVLITGDVKTMVGFAWARVEARQPMRGVLALRTISNIGRTIEDILLIAECYTEAEMKDQVKYIPL